MRRFLFIISMVLVVLSASFLVSCSGSREEVSLEDIDAIKKSNNNKVLEKILYKPGPPKYEKGMRGGTFYSFVQSDPKSFNTLNARDGFTAVVTDHFYPQLFDYNIYERKFVADMADFSVEYKEDIAQTEVTITMRDDIYWTSADGNREKITSDDVVFWFNEVEGDPAVQHPGYPGHFMTKPDGTKAEIKLVKIDDRRAKFIIPLIIANPLLYVSMSFGPKYIFEKAKQENGVSGMLDVLSVASDPRTVPSAGKYMLSKYQQGQYVELIRNPDYWKKDAFGGDLPYIDTIRINIIASEDQALLSFKNGDLDSYSVRPEDLDDLVEEQSDKNIYDIYGRGSSLGSAFISFNQNPNALDEVKYSWFSNKKFRQAMSMLLPRERIIQEVYRGLAEPAEHFFSKANLFYDEDIRLDYLYDVERARQYLEDAGFSLGEDGILVDEQGNPVEFSLNIGVENSLAIDMANLFAEELKKVGIVLNVMPIDFQTLVDKVTKSYQWDSVMVSLGVNYWPSSGSNVWQSNGNFHLWYPLQKSPATDWEAELDSLYQEGLYTVDDAERKKVYDKFQRIILEQLPVIYIVHPENFVAYNKRVKNLYIDNLEGSKLEFLYLSE